MDSKHRLIIIYLPNGNERKYCTKDLEGKEYQLAEKIECDPGIVSIAIKEDDKIVGHSYTGMPYYLEMF